MGEIDKTASGINPPTEKPAHKWPAWHSELANYRTPSTGAACRQLLNTFVPYCGLWGLLVLAIRHDWPLALTVLMIVTAALFLVRLFILFHDCVHGSFFPNKRANAFFGHLLGLLVFTPFDDWRFSHLRHHASYADLDARGFGDIWTMTREEYETASRAKQLGYRLYRNPTILFGMGALFSFLLRYRLPTYKAKRKERMSVILTNLLLVCIVLIAIKTIGWKTYLLIQVPVMWLAGAIGVWLFFVQHQFEGVYWARRKDWDALRAAMDGSSYYKLPTILRWFSANIGYHHIHHLSARIPNYRLQQCCADIPALANKPALTIRNSLAGAHLKLWDEQQKQLIRFR